MPNFYLATAFSLWFKSLYEVFAGRCLDGLEATPVAGLREKLIGSAL